MNLQRFRGGSKILAGAMIVSLGMAGWGVARASQKFFTPGVHISMKMADPAEGPSKTGFAPVVKSVLPDVVNISTSKVVKASDQPDMQDGMPDGMPPFFQQFFGRQYGPNSENRSPKASPRSRGFQVACQLPCGQIDRLREGRGPCIQKSASRHAQRPKAPLHDRSLTCRDGRKCSLEERQNSYTYQAPSIVHAP